MWPKDLLSIDDLAVQDVDSLFELVAECKRNPARFASACRGQVLGMLFRKPSTRTRVSFEVGIFQLGGTGLMFRADDLQLGRGETISDTAKVMSRYVDGMMVRTFSHDEVVEFAAHASIPVINGLTDLLHPCQGLTDYFTMWEQGKEFKGLRVAYLGDGNNVAHSLMFGAARLGVHLRLGIPEGYEPDPSIMAAAREKTGSTGATIEIFNDPCEAVAEAEVIYTDVWASMGQEEEEEERNRLFRPFQVNGRLVARAHPEWIFLHCLPAHRGLEVSDEIADHPRSVIFDQAENRLHVQKGIMLNLMGRDGTD